MIRSGGGLAGEVTDARRSELASEWREAVATDANVLTAHPLAEEYIVETLFTESVDALSEAYRQLALLSVRRDRFRITVQLNSETQDRDLGDVVMLRYPRFLLESPVGDDLDLGQPMLIVGVEPDIEKNEVTFSLWGTAGSRRNLVNEDGDYLITADGLYMVTD